MHILPVFQTISYFCMSKRHFSITSKCSLGVFSFLWSEKLTDLKMKSSWSTLWHTNIGTIYLGWSFKLISGDIWELFVLNSQFLQRICFLLKQYSHNILPLTKILVNNFQNPLFDNRKVRIKWSMLSKI